MPTPSTGSADIHACTHAHSAPARCAPARPDAASLRQRGRRLITCVAWHGRTLWTHVCTRSCIRTVAHLRADARSVLFYKHSSPSLSLLRSRCLALARALSAAKCTLLPIACNHRTQPTLMRPCSMAPSLRASPFPARRPCKPSFKKGAPAAVSLL